MIRVFIVDDHALIREGLKKILDDKNEFQVVGEATNTNEALEKLYKTDCDIVLADINLPGRNGLELIEEIKQIRPLLHTLVISIYPEEHYAIRALKTGASGYIKKDSASDELLIAIRTILSRGKYISPSVAQILADNLEKANPDSPHECLSNRELEVMYKVASGKSVREIAKELSLSISSVNSYRTRVMEKMQMRSNIELTFYAIQKKLID